MTKQNKIIIGVVVGVLVLAYVGIVAFRVGPVNVGNVVVGEAPRFASTTQFTLTNATAQIAATTTCAARIITTGPVAVALSFGQALDGLNLGHQQAASTTVTYDAGVYGCPNVKARSSGASVLLTITETQ